MSGNPLVSNYNGRQPNSTAYIKNFVSVSPPGLWTSITPDLSTLYLANGIITNASPYYRNVLIQGDLTVNGTIFNPSDVSIKENIEEIEESKSKKILNLKPVEYTLKKDETKKLHYGFKAQDLEEIFPELVTEQNVDKFDKIKTVNYIEMIPLLVSRIQKMEKEIEYLKSQ
jgi:hypothetical protein